MHYLEYSMVQQHTEDCIWNECSESKSHPKVA